MPVKRKPIHKRPAKRASREESDLPKNSLRAFRVGEGLPNMTLLVSELQEMWDVLLGRVDPPKPVRGSVLSLMEVADAYYARASEIKGHLQRLEREGRVVKGSPHYKFRVGELQTFMEVARKSSDLGSRRLTEETMRREAEIRGREYD